MNNAQSVLKRIGESGKSFYQISKATGISISLFGKWNKAPNSSVTSQNLALIADYLNVSVDYLLGRTNNPAVNADTSVINNGSITGNIDHNNGTVNVSSNDDIRHTMSKDEVQLLQLYGTMDIRQRAKLLNIALEIADSKQDNEK